jgi:hypothetical protein
MNWKELRPGSGSNLTDETDQASRFVACSSCFQSLI